MSLVIAPTIGRRVWYWPSQEDFLSPQYEVNMGSLNANQAFDAGVIFVHNERTVNLLVTDHLGHSHARGSVELWQGDMDRPSGAYCEWMPFQKGQAAKAAGPAPTAGAINAMWQNAQEVAAQAGAAINSIAGAPRATSRIRSYVCGVTCKAGRENCNNYCNFDTSKPMPKAPATFTEELMTFGVAIAMLKRGLKVARTGWNGKGMFLFLVPGSTFKVSRPPLLGIYPEGKEINYHAHIDMKTADDKVVPWLASQTDVLAEDWVLVP